MKQTAIAVCGLLFLAALLYSSPAAVPAADVLKDPEWQQNYDAFDPNPALLAALREKIGVDLQVDVYFGFWCGDSKAHVPPFLKIVDTLHAEGLTVNYFELPRKEKPEQRFFVEELKVERVPTFIFYRAGTEIGRIVENPTRGILEDFLAIVF